MAIGSGLSLVVEDKEKINWDKLAEEFSHIDKPFTEYLDDQYNQAKDVHFTVELEVQIEDMCLFADIRLECGELNLKLSNSLDSGISLSENNLEQTIKYIKSKMDLDIILRR